ncbi:MAG: hypothetical protein ACXIUZ_01950 [Lysobacteraceae bacterium]
MTPTNSTAAYEATPRGKAKKLIRDARRRADRIGVEFDLTFEWVEGRILQGRCERTGLPFYLEQSKWQFAGPLSPSLDRIDPEKGYTTDNTRVVVWVYNQAKGRYGDGVVLAMAKGLLRNEGEQL